MIDKLELKMNASVLETGVGTGCNLPIIANRIGRQSRIDGMDISSAVLHAARIRIKGKDVLVELIQGNASYLPYRSENFDAVFHVGAFNQFGDKKRAIEEMLRVAKPGAKFVICDEGLSPGKEKSLHGKWILKWEPVLFSERPPINIIPNGVRNHKVYWIWQKTFWVLEFRKEN